MTKEEDLLDIDALKEACKKAEIPYPKKLGKQILNPQVKSFIYELAVAFKKKEKRYIYTLLFSHTNLRILLLPCFNPQRSPTNTLRFLKNTTLNFDIF